MPSHAVYLSPRYIKKSNPILTKNFKAPNMGKFQVFTHARDSKDDETLMGVMTPPGTALPHIKTNLYSPENRRSMQQYTN